MIMLAAFAIYRLSSLISKDEGPYLSLFYKDDDGVGIFRWIRKKAGAEKKIYTYDDRGNLRIQITTNLGRGISCPLCVGAYVAAFILILMSISSPSTNIFISWLGLWGIQTFLENLTSDDAVEDAIQDVADSLEEK